MTEQELRQISYETLSVIASEKYIVNGKTYNMRGMVMDMVNRTQVYKASDDIRCYCRDSYEPRYFLMNMTTIGAVLHFNQLVNQSIGVLNFASAIKAGGGWLSGKIAQEEDIMRKTTAFLSLILQDKFYTRHSKTNPIYSDAFIYSPCTLIIRDDQYQFIEPKRISLYTCAAVNLTECRKQHIKCDSFVMENRIDRIIRTMANNYEDTIVLGAFGCGVFGNNPIQIAEAFRAALVKERLEYEFKNIIFAVLDNSSTQQNYNAFQSVFFDRL